MMANSMTSTKINGRLALLNTISRMRRIAMMEIASTTTKSWSVTLMRSLVAGASPMSVALGSYSLMIDWISSHCALTASVEG